jgi:hypothetical protein
VQKVNIMATIAHNSQPKCNGSNWRGIVEDVRPMGNAGGVVFNHSRDGQVGREERIK